MIHEAAHTLEERGFNIVEQVTDDWGTIGYVLSFIGQRYCLVAKEYAYDDMASFMTRLVVHAPDDMAFIFYCKDDDSYTIFDGQYLRENATPSSGPSKQRDCSWRELSLHHGADLDAYICGGDTPTTLAGANTTLEDYE